MILQKAMHGHLQVAFGADGEATKALAGFCKKNGVQVEDVIREADAKGVEYVWAVKHQQGLPAAQVCFWRPYANSRQIDVPVSGQGIAT